MFLGSVVRSVSGLLLTAVLLGVVSLFLVAPEVAAQAGTQTINFNDRTGTLQQLNGEYPTSVINWGTGQWVLSGPWRRLTTTSISFNGGTPRSATFTFVSPRRLLSLVAYNGGSSSTTVTISCSGQPNVQRAIPADTLVTITTGWTGVCSPVTIASTNGWDTNYDDFIIDTGGPVDTQPPTVTAVTPANGATGVLSSVLVGGTFSEALNAATVSSSTLMVACPTPLAGSVNYDANLRQASFSATGGLPANQTCAATLKGGSSGIKDVAGNALASDYTWTFQTRDTIPPSVRSVVPENGSTGVGAGALAVANFSEELDPNTVTTSTVMLACPTPLAGTAGYEVGSRNAFFDPTGSLPPGETCTATMKGGSGGLKDLAGNPLAADFTWTFIVRDATPPTVTAVTPSNGATGVASTAVVVGTFSEPLDSRTVNTSTLTVSCPTALSGTVSYDATLRQASFSATGGLPVNQTCTARFRGTSQGINDVSGNWLQTDYTWSFQTNRDTVPPTVVSTSPVNGATGVVSAVLPSANFSEDLDPSTVTSSTMIVACPMPLPGTVNYQPGTPGPYFMATGGLPANATCTVTMKGGPNGIKDLAGNSLAADYTWTFSTQDTIAPTVVTVTPASGEVVTPAPSSMSMTFSEVIDSATLTQATILIGCPQQLGFRTVSFDAATRRATVEFWAQLADSWTCTVTLKSGSSGIKDLAGNPLATDYTWTFQTGVSTPAQIRMTPAPESRAIAPGARVAFAFAGAMDPASISTTTFNVSCPAPLAGTVTYDATTQEATFVATGGLPLNQMCQVLVKGGDSGVRYLAGFGLSWDYRWWFETQDTIAPTVTSATPTNATPRVGSATWVAATFTELLAPSSVNASTFVVSCPTPLTGSTGFDQSSRRAVFVATGGLPFSQVCTATLKGGSAGIKDTSGNALAGDYSWSFRVSDPPVYMLTVQRNGSGSGLVRGSPTGIDCGPVCNANQSAGSVVTLTATPDPGSVFTGWAGACSGTGACSATINAAKTVVATFDAQSPDLAVSMTATPSTAAVGADVTYTITITNRGSLTAGGTLRDPIPAGAAFASTSACTFTGSMVTCDIPPLAKGESTTRTIVLRPTVFGTLENVVQVVGGTDFDDPNNTASVSTTVTQTVPFDDRAGQNLVLNGQYPSNVIDWGSNRWYLSAPWRRFTTKSIGFNGGSLRSASFNLLKPGRLVRLDAYNGGGSSSTVTLSCAGQTNRVVSLAADQLATIDTGWIGTCTTVTIATTNGWDTNFDNLVLDGGTCGNAASPCPDLSVTSSGLPASITAAPYLPLTLTVNVRNNGTTPARIPAGTRLVRYTLPTVLASGIDPVVQDQWDRRQRKEVQPSTNLVNVVAYTSYNAPTGYRCTDPLAGVTVPECSTTTADTLQPGEQRSFQFAITMFDPRNPYLHVEDSVVWSGQPITSTASVTAVANPDGKISESDAGNNSVASTATIKAPYLDFVPGWDGGCPLNTTLRNAEVAQRPDGHVVTTGTWRCKVHLDTSKSSAPIHLRAGSLRMFLEVDKFTPFTPRQLASTTCDAAVESSGVAVQALECDGLTQINCTNAQDIDVAAGDAINCATTVTVVVVDLLQPGSVPGERMGWEEVDVFPNLYELTSEIIRFASPTTFVKYNVDRHGGTVGWG